MIIPKKSRLKNPKNSEIPWFFFGISRSGSALSKFWLLRFPGHRDFFWIFWKSRDLCNFFLYIGILILAFSQNPRNSGFFSFRGFFIPGIEIFFVGWDIPTKSQLWPRVKITISADLGSLVLQNVAKLTGFHEKIFESSETAKCLSTLVVTFEDILHLGWVCTGFHLFVL